MARFFVFLAAAVALFGQTSGTISGSISDQSGAAVASAQVVAISSNTNEKRQTVSASSGQYSFPFLAPGEYRIEASLAGFSTSVATAVLTDDAALGRVVDGNAMKELPLSSRNFTQLLGLSPGTSGPLNDAGALGRGTQNISSGGARLGSNSVYIDGVDSVNIHSNTSNENAFASNGLVAPSPEAIQEFKVQTGLYDAQSGRSGGRPSSWLPVRVPHSSTAPCSTFCGTKPLTQTAFSSTPPARPGRC